MNISTKSKAKVIRDIGRTSIHFKVPDDLFEKFSNLLSIDSTTKQKHLEEHVRRFVQDRESQQELNL